MLPRCSDFVFDVFLMCFCFDGVFCLFVLGVFVCFLSSVSSFDVFYLVYLQTPTLLCLFITPIEQEISINCLGTPKSGVCHSSSENQAFFLPS